MEGTPMSGERIFMRNDLDQDPRVVKIAARCNRRPVEIVGCLWWLWSRGDIYTEDGNLPHLDAALVDHQVGVPGFAAALAEVGWLEIRANGNDGIRIPRFSEYNSQSARRRLRDTVRKYRNRNACPPDVRSVSAECPMNVPESGKRKASMVSSEGEGIVGDIRDPTKSTKHTASEEPTRALKNSRGVFPVGTTWLTPFGDILQAVSAGEVNWKMLAVVIAPVVDGLAKRDALTRPQAMGVALERWGNFVEAIDFSRPYNLHAFTNTHGQYDKPRVLRTPVRSLLAADRTAEAFANVAARIKREGKV